MSRTGRRKYAKHNRDDPTRAMQVNAPNLALDQMRFDTHEASARFLTLRYVDPAWSGVRDDSVRLPPNDRSVSSMPTSGGLVYRAFSHGLMYGDETGAVGGSGLFLAAILIFAASVQLILGGTNPILSVYSSMTEMGTFFFIALLFLALVMLAVAPLILMFIANDLIGFRFHNSALFDCRAGKVHLFTDRSVPWAPWRYQVTSYDWRCVHAEIDTVDIRFGPSVHTEARLWCVVTGGPDGTIVIDQFKLGANTQAQNLQPLFDTWEHARRFMQHEGPLFASDEDRPNSALGRQPLWKHLLAHPKLHWEAMIDMFRIAWRDKYPFALFTGVLAVITFPAHLFLVFWGVLPWLSGLAKRDPVWPEDIIASVGGSALSGDALDASCGALPDPTPATPGAHGDNPDVP